MQTSQKTLSILLIIYIVFSYFAPILQLQFGENLITTNTGTIVLFLLFFVQIKNGKSKSIMVFIPILLVVLFIFLFSFILNVSRFQSEDFAQNLINIISIPIIIFIFHQISFESKIINLVLKTLVICSLVNSLIALFSLYGGGFNLFGLSEGMGRFMGYDETSGRSGGSRGENYVGFWNVPALIYFLYNLFNDKKKLFNILGFALVFIGIVASLSRSSVLTAILAIVCVLYLNKKKINPFYFAISLSVVFTLLFIVIKYQFSIMDDLIYQNQLERWNINGKDIGGDRYGPWNFWINEFLNSSLLFGNGPGYIGLRLGDGISLIPHNSNIDVLVEFGLFGLLLFLYPVYYSVKIFFNKMIIKDYFLAINVTIFMSMFLSLFFLSSPYLKNYWLFFGLIVGRYDFLLSKKKMLRK